MYQEQTEKNYIKDKLSDRPPKKCKFKVGDTVTFTNDNGVKFKSKTVIGFSDGNILKNGAFIHLNGYAPYWSPVLESSLSIEVKNTPSP